MIGSMGSELQLDQKTKEQLQNRDFTALANESMEHLDPGDAERKKFSALLGLPTKLLLKRLKPTLRADVMPRFALHSD